MFKIQGYKTSNSCIETIYTNETSDLKAIKSLAVIRSPENKNKNNLNCMCFLLTKIWIIQLPSHLNMKTQGKKKSHKAATQIFHKTRNKKHNTKNKKQKYILDEENREYIEVNFRKHYLRSIT